MAKIYLSFNNQAEAFEFPVLPEEVEIKESGNNKSHILQNIGEITVINTIKAPTLKLESFFPINSGPYVTSKYLLKPNEYIEKIKRWRDTGKPVRLVITGTSVDLSWACTIEDFSYKEKAGAVGDIEYIISFKEYRWFKVKKVEIVSDSKTSQPAIAKTEQRPVEKEKPKTYTVQKGDTLCSISKKCLGDSGKYKEIAKKNNIANPSLIYPGQVLQL
ncbi:LysM peptidoglycan-binding domain-containing protein [Zhenhengia yiwuensis]|uniref:LysM peptidoglycan-binding domain-containing protein n=1 Tax=Zhenhengia yiwuensis TaxID=2763666 RepID=A0A926EMD4_9FIRM|nr:LysM peptidoglycan-binding domain-containing protein [Zhenhengia yiwuensis]MBC8581710.1 LysM peptidoglycan-binding domain-containing protein [Zhenhengia yiwuensis]MDY3367463.1 LysM peptidoglycan-binding domain-containing protein [Zhenhengia yiwuensis]